VFISSVLQIYLVQFIRLVMLVDLAYSVQSKNWQHTLAPILFYIGSNEYQHPARSNGQLMNSILVNLCLLRTISLFCFSCLCLLFRQLELVGGLSQQLILIKVFYQLSRNKVAFWVLSFIFFRSNWGTCGRATTRRSWFMTWCKHSVRIRFFYLFTALSPISAFMLFNLKER